MGTSFYGWMASCTTTKPDPPYLHQPRLSTLADCFTERPGSSSASPLPYIKPSLFSKSSSALLHFHFFLALRSPLFDFLILTFSLHPTPSLQAFLSPSGSRQRLTLPIPKVSHAVRLQGTTHTLCPHHWHTTHIQTRPGHPCED